MLILHLCFDEMILLSIQKKILDTRTKFTYDIWVFEVKKGSII